MSNLANKCEMLQKIERKKRIQTNSFACILPQLAIFCFFKKRCLNNKNLFLTFISNLYIHEIYLRVDILMEKLILV